MKRFAKVYVEITNRCNRSCAFCPGTKRSPREMSAAEFRAAAEKLRPYTDYLYFHVMGEPLFHPALEQFLEIAAEFGFRVILTTNGTLLQQRLPILLGAAALHKVNVSLHSFEANEQGSFAGYVEGCCSAALQLSANGVLVNLRLWNLDGAHGAGLHQKNDDLLSLIEKSFPTPWQDVRGGVKLGERVYLNFGERFLWPDPDGEDYGERRFCYGLRDQLGVLCDGTVVPCCLDHEGELALGNLYRQSVEEILQGERAAAIYNGFSDGKAIEPLCRRCEYSTRFR